MMRSFRAGLLASSLLLGFIPEALAQSRAAEGGSPPPQDRLPRHTPEITGTPVVGQEQLKARQQELEQARPEAKDWAKELSREPYSAGTEFGEGREQTKRLLKEAEALRDRINLLLAEAEEQAQVHNRTDAVAQDLAPARQELEANKQLLKEAEALRERIKSMLAEAEEQAEVRNRTDAQDLATAQQEPGGSKQRSTTANKDDERADTYQLDRYSNATKPEQNGDRNKIETGTLPKARSNIRSDLHQLAKNVLSNYLAAWSSYSSATVHSVSSFYGSRVWFHGKNVSIHDLIEEKRRFLQRWPVREYRARPTSVVVQCDGVKDSCKVASLLEYRAENPTRKRRATGVANLELQVSFSTGRPEIVEENSSPVQVRACRKPCR